MATYYVKAHRNFQVSGDSLAHITSDRVHYVDYKELFAGLGIGPTVEFVWSAETVDLTVSETGLLIASLDLAQNTTTGRAIAFTPFVSLRRNLRCALQEKGLDGEALVSQLDADLHAVLTTSIARRDLKCIDLLSRIMHLNDVLVNSGNFGQLVSTGAQVEELGWKVVDFTVGFHKLYGTVDPYIVANIKHEFEVVNGAFCYDENPPLRRALCESVQQCRQVKGLSYPNATVPPGC
jgi:hypothetical protein